MDIYLDKRAVKQIRISADEAIEEGEGSRAEAVAREHARLARRNLDIVLRSERALEQLPGAGLIVLEGGAQD